MIITLSTHNQNFEIESLSHCYTKFHFYFISGPAIWRCGTITTSTYCFEKLSRSYYFVCPFQFDRHAVLMQLHEILIGVPKDFRHQAKQNNVCLRKCGWPKKRPPGRQGIHFYSPNFQTIHKN